MEELRQRVDKVYDLRDEEEQHGFAEMAEDPNHSECHPSKVTERVPYEHRRWVPVVVEESQRGEKERDHEVQRENMVISVVSIELQYIEDDDGAGDEEGLPGLDAIDPGQDVDGIRAEHSQHSHIYIIQDTQVEVHPQQDSERFGNHYDSVAEVGEVDHEERQ